MVDESRGLSLGKNFIEIWRIDGWIVANVRVLGC